MSHSRIFAAAAGVAVLCLAVCGCSAPAPETYPFPAGWAVATDNSVQLEVDGDGQATLRGTPVATSPCAGAPFWQEGEYRWTPKSKGEIFVEGPVTSDSQHRMIVAAKRPFGSVDWDEVAVSICKDADGNDVFIHLFGGSG